MSVTFQPKGLFGDYVPHECEDPELCRMFLPPGHESCPGDYVETGVNFHNAAAQALMLALGIPFDDGTGELDADVLAGAVMDQLVQIELGWADDSGIETVDDHQPGCCRSIECGEAPGSKARRLEALMAVCRQAKSLGVPVAWG